MTGSFNGLAATDAFQLVRTGQLAVLGRLTSASNVTLYCEISDPATGAPRAKCVYKPVAGERPLWDFPDGTLAGREVAAYAVSEALGWRIVPPTAYREGPYGPGMCQLWVDGDPDVDLVELARRREHPGLRRMAVFDAVINNSDRKIGHLLPTPGGHLYGCDHGVSFAEEYKLRTVLWQWQGEPIPEGERADLRKLRETLRNSASAPSTELAKHLTAPERFALASRIELLCDPGVHPYPSPDWPSVPWPPI